VARHPRAKDGMAGRRHAFLAEVSGALVFESKRQVEIG
jgi:hypothetical protein